MISIKPQWLFLLIVQCLYPHNIIFIQIGNNIPMHLCDAVEQARLFNTSCDMYILINKSSRNNQIDRRLNAAKAIMIDLETLEKTKEHIDFLHKTSLNRQSREGFWFYASERFLYLNDFCQQYKIHNIIHLESDNMLYVDLSKLMPIFEKHYRRIGAVFDNDERCIPGFIYFANADYTQKLASYFAEIAPLGKNDMEVIAMFCHQHPTIITNLPIIMNEYVKDNKLITATGHTTQNPSKYCNHVDEFDSIFDAAAIGQYLGGIDPRNGPSKPGFINESCLFNPALLTFEWIHDESGRRIPYATYKTKRVRINNLHIHSKNLRMFSSILQKDPS